MSELSVTLLELIEKVWIKTVFDEFLKRKQIWWIERDIADTLYYFLRPAIKLIPQYDLFSEWCETSYEY